MITINIILILKILGIAFLISNFEPIQWLFDAVPDGWFKWTGMLLFGCLKCVSFWASLIWTGDIFFSIFLLFIAKAISNDDLYKYYTGLMKERLSKWYHATKIQFYHWQMNRIIKKLEEDEERS